MFSKTDEELLQESLENIIDLMARRDIELLESFVYELQDEQYFHEGVAENVRHAKNKVVSTTKRVNRTVNHKINKAGDHLDNLIKIAKKDIIGANRDEIMSNHIKVSTIVKGVLKSGIVTLIHPVAGLVYMCTKLILKGKLRTREREKILADLKLELEICEEKINDATNAGDKQKKYELMRLRNELKRSILRLQNAGRGIRNIG